MKTIIFSVSFGLALAGSSLVASAGPLQRSDVAASPAWLAHVDWDALRNTTIGQFLQSEMDKPEVQAKLAAFQALVSFDLRTQLHGTTLYGTGTAPEDAVLLLYADFDPDRLVTLAKAAKDSQNSPYKNHTIYNWIDEKKHKHGGNARVYAAIDGKRVVFGQREASVTQALDVLDGLAPNLTSTKVFASFGAPGDPNFLEAAGRKFDIAEGNPNAAILRLSKQVGLQIAQVQNQITASLTLEANDDEVASHISSIAQGLVALMKLQTNNAGAVKIADALTLKQEGPRVVAALSLPADDVVNTIKADAARKAALKQKKEAEAESK